MSVPRRPTPDTESGVSDAELAEIARHLRAVLPDAHAAAPPASPPVPAPPVEHGAGTPPVVRYVASFVVPGLALLAVALVLRMVG